MPFPRASTQSPMRELVAFLCHDRSAEPLLLDAIWSGERVVIVASAGYQRRLHRDQHGIGATSPTGRCVRCWRPTTWRRLGIRKRSVPKLCGERSPQTRRCRKCAETRCSHPSKLRKRWICHLAWRRCASRMSRRKLARFRSIRRRGASSAASESISSPQLTLFEIRCAPR